MGRWTHQRTDRIVNGAVRCRVCTENGVIKIGPDRARGRRHGGASAELRRMDLDVIKVCGTNTEATRGPQVESAGATEFIKY